MSPTGHRIGSYHVDATWRRSQVGQAGRQELRANRIASVQAAGYDDGSQ